MFKTCLNEEVAWQWTENLPSVAAYVRSMTADFHDAQDILQEVSMAVVRKYGEYDHHRPFVAWAIGIARNEILAYRRRMSIDRQVFDREAFNLITEAFAAAERDEVSPLLEALEKCLRRAQGKSRRLLEMRYVEDLRYEQMAGKLSVSVVSVKVAMHRLRSVLRDCIQRRLEPQGIA